MVVVLGLRLTTSLDVVVVLGLRLTRSFVVAVVGVAVVGESQTQHNNNIS